jgi:hypothetical protein
LHLRLQAGQLHLLQPRLCGRQLPRLLQQRPPLLLLLCGKPVHPTAEQPLQWTVRGRGAEHHRAM